MKQWPYQTGDSRCNYHETRPSLHLRNYYWLENSCNFTYFDFLHWFTKLMAPATRPYFRHFMHQHKSSMKKIWPFFLLGKKREMCPFFWNVAWLHHWMWLFKGVIQNAVEYLKLFLQNAPSLMFDRVLNTPLDIRNCKPRIRQDSAH